MSATLPCVMGHIQGMCFSFVIRRCLCYPSRDFPVPVYLFVVILVEGSGSRMPFVNCLVVVRSLYHSTALHFVTRHLYWACVSYVGAYFSVILYAS